MAESLVNQGLHFLKQVSYFCAAPKIHLLFAATFDNSLTLLLPICCHHPPSKGKKRKIFLARREVDFLVIILILCKKST